MDPTKRQTRAVILETAVGIASKHGLEQLTLGRLAAAVKMSKSGLFAHFRSKEDLQLATVEEAWRIFEAEVLAGRDGESAGGLDALLERWLSYYERKVLPGGCLFKHQAVEFASRPGPVAKALRAAVARQIQALEQQVVAAKRGGSRRDARQVAFELYSLLTNADELYHVEHDEAVFDRARAAIRAGYPAAVKPGRSRATTRTDSAPGKVAKCAERGRRAN